MAQDNARRRFARKIFRGGVNHSDYQIDKRNEFRRRKIVDSRAARPFVPALSRRERFMRRRHKHHPATYERHAFEQHVERLRRVGLSATPAEKF